MNTLIEHALHCPYCGEPISVLIDCSAQSQEYVEDCQVCCRPLVLTVSVEPTGEATISARNENDA